MQCMITKKFRTDLIRRFLKIQTLKFFSEKETCTAEKLMKKFDFSQSSLYKFLGDLEEENLIIRDGKQEGENNHSLIVYHSTDSMDEFLFFIKRDLMEVLKRLCNNSIEHEVCLEIMREVIAEFKYVIMLNIITQIKEYLDQLTSQKDVNPDFFRNLEEYMYDHIKSIIEYPFLRDIISDSPQKSNSLKILRDVIAKFKDDIIPNIIILIKEYLDQIKSQKDTNVNFKNMEEYLYDHVKSIIENPFLRDMTSESSQRPKVREHT